MFFSEPENLTKNSTPVLKPKAVAYRGGFHIFPEHQGKFDQTSVEFIRNLIWKSVETLEKPTMVELSKDLGVNKARLSRIMEMLGMNEEYEFKKAERIAVFYARRKVSAKFNEKKSTVIRRQKKKA